MIILIAGASHTGKTVLAQKMLEKYKYPYLSIDHLKMGLIRSKNTVLTPEDDDELTSYLWPIIREIIKTAVENRQDLIIEGCYVPFDWRSGLTKEYLQSIRFICLAFSEEYIHSHIADIKAHGSDIETRIDDSFCTAEQLIRDNRRMSDGFQRCGETVTLITDDYETRIQELLDMDL